MSKTGVANEALILLGNNTLSDISSDTTTEATIANLTFDSTRQDLLRQHPWNFAIKRASLAASVTDPVFRYDKAYPIPSDCLRVLTVDSTEDWKLENNEIICDLESPILLKYVADITDDTTWDASFHKTFVYKLAADMSYALIPDDELRRGILNMFLVQLSMARGVDGTEDVEDTWGIGGDEFVQARSDYDVWSG